MKKLIINLPPNHAWLVKMFLMNIFFSKSRYCFGNCSMVTFLWNPKNLQKTIIFKSIFFSQLNLMRWHFPWFHNKSYKIRCRRNSFLCTKYCLYKIDNIAEWHSNSSQHCLILLNKRCTEPTWSRFQVIYSIFKDFRRNSSLLLFK